MKNLVKFFLFIIYTISIFLVKDFKFLVLFLGVNIIICKISKIKLKDIVNNLKLLLPFILFTSFLNIILDSWVMGVIIGIRIIFCYNITYIFSKSLTVFEIAEVIEKLFFPYKLFKINTKNIGIMVSISLCMIPIMKNEIISLKNTMKIKGKKMKFNNFLIIMKPMLISILRKTSQLEKSIISKAYVE